MFKLMLLSALVFVAPKGIYDFKVDGLDGKKKINFSDYKGKKILIVNTASKCGLTPQYEGLEALYQKYKGQLVIVGFPANNFNGQEPGTNQEIQQFCTSNYSVTFPMSAKISVKETTFTRCTSGCSQKARPNISRRKKLPGTSRSTCWMKKATL
ncbi:glutathione peroxidase [Chitinophaga horti]|uniref:Glutathione peroxidase n=1 Tax=Chitinophaga horti TaxID=2920382 RepID=A0ABY6J425_9BACT|nr:glutathione peroxidase [Chitinophaga horti]UYQ92957.1 glutathione peroxidase [Chitinophaga horti]